MTKTRAIEVIAYTWHSAVMAGNMEKDDTYQSGIINGMITMLALMEDETKHEIYESVVKFAKSHGLQIK